MTTSKDWLLFAAASDQLHMKYGSGENAAKALRQMAIAGSLATKARSASSWRGGVELETYSEWEVPRNVWVLAIEPSALNKSWEQSNFNTPRGYDGEQISYLLSEVSVDQAEVRRLVATMPDVPLTLGEQQKRRVGPFAPFAPSPLAAVVGGSPTADEPAREERRGRRRKGQWNDWVAALAKVAADGEVTGNRTDSALFDKINEQLAAWGVEELSRSTVQGAISAVLERFRADGI